MSSATPEWGTPQDLYDRLDAIYNFMLDPCASHQNHKAPAYYTKEEDGLTKPWDVPTFMNPPYGRGIFPWIKKAAWESQIHSSVVVCLVPARTDTQWFQYCFRNARCITFLPGRLKFVMPDGKSSDSAPFPTALVVFAPSRECAGYLRLCEFGPTYMAASVPADSTTLALTDRQPKTIITVQTL